MGAQINVAGSNNSGQLLYRSVVGYLGTIEMPEDANNQPTPAGGAGVNGGTGNSSAAARLAAIR